MRKQFFDLRPGDVLTIGGDRITLEAKSGQRARVKVESDQPTSKARADAAPMPRPSSMAPAAVPFLPRPKPA